MIMNESDETAAVDPRQLLELEELLRERMKSDDPGSYTAKLLQGDPARIRGKISEEAFEVNQASERHETEHIAEEIADLWFHTMLLLVRHGLSVTDVMKALAARKGKRRDPSHGGAS